MCLRSVWPVRVFLLYWLSLATFRCYVHLCTDLHLPIMNVKRTARWRTSKQRQRSRKVDPVSFELFSIDWLSRNEEPSRWLTDCFGFLFNNSGIGRSTVTISTAIEPSLCERDETNSANETNTRRTTKTETELKEMKWDSKNARRQRWRVSGANEEKKQRNPESKEAADLLLQTMPTTVEYNFVKNTPADY